MNTPSNSRLLEVLSHFKSGDLHIGYRRLIDSVFETQDLALFRQMFAFCNFFDTYNGNHEDLLANVSELILKIEKATPQSKPISDKPLVSLKNVYKTYSSSGFGLKAIDLELNQGEIIGLVGENGNGKTSLLRTIAGELAIDKGSISYGIKKESDDAYATQSQIAYIEQRLPRWYGTLTDNLQFTLSCQGIYGEENVLRSELMIARLGLRPYKNLSWNKLSSGYKTRFEIARTLLKNPRILLLDEPLANLDIRAQQTILQDLRFIVQSAHNPMGIILSSQHIYEVEKVSDKILFLKQGKPFQEEPGTVSDSTSTHLVVEIELLNAAKETVERHFKNLAPTEITFNGGVYVLRFEQSNMNQVLSSLANSNLQVVYVRDITRSASRYFLQP